MRAWVDIAVLVRTKNLTGELVAHSASGSSVFPAQGMECALVPPVPDAPRRVHVASVRSCGDEEAIISFDEVDSIETAEALVGCHCLVRREDVEATGVSVSALSNDCVGWEAYDSEAGFLGVVDRIENRVSQPLLVIERADKAELLVPFVDELIVSLDETTGRIELACPQGLLDL